MTKVSSLPPGPKYVQLADRIRLQIATGELRPGDRLPSLAEMHSAQGFSRTTVERVHVALEQEGLIVREQGRGTFVKAPETGRLTGVIGISGLLTHWRQHPYFLHLLEGVREGLENSGYELLILNDDSPIHAGKVDGVLNCEPVVETVLRRMSPHMPFVTLFSNSSVGSCVITDDMEGVASAIRHLLSLGHRRIAYLITEQDVPSSRRRKAGYREALESAGIEPLPGWMYKLRDDSPRTSYCDIGKAAMVKWLAGGWTETGCTALLAQNDDVAIGAIEAMQENGIRVPEQVSVVGFDGTELGRRVSPALTTIEVPLREIGRKAIEQLIAQIHDPETRMPVQMFPLRLIVRESTAPIRARTGGR